MYGPSADGFSYLLDDQPNTFILTPGFLTPYPKGLFAQGGNDFIIGASDSELISGDSGNDRVLGGAGNDTFYAGKGNDYLSGNAGNDIIYGGQNNDFLEGGIGNDLLSAGKNDDTLVGDKGQDTLTGGLGADLFVLRTDSASTAIGAADIITDFNSTVDNIGLTGGLTEADLSLEEYSTNNNQIDTLIRVTNTGAILGRVYSTSPDELLGHFISINHAIGGDLSQAQNLGNLNTTRTINGSINNDNPQDIYRFTTTNTSDVQFTLNGLSANADLALIKDGNNNNFIDASDIMIVPHSPGTSPETINVNGLSPGNYYLQVAQIEGNTNYNLTLSTTTTAASITPPDNQSTHSFDPRFGYGLVDAAAAVARALGVSSLPKVPDLGGNLWPRDLINAPEVWQKGITGKGVIVALIDSGIDYNHPDLKNNIWNNLGENGLDSMGQNKATNGIDDDGNGYVDDYHGWDFIGNDNDPIDTNGHGTHNAGTIAANGKTFKGVAPDATIMPIRILDQNGVGDTGNEVKAIRYAVNNGAKVINLSVGGAYFNQQEADAIKYAEDNGVVVVSASGNKSLSQPDYPSRLADQYGLAVGSIQQDQKISSFSNRAGSTPINYVVAPGGDAGLTGNGEIYSTAPLSFPSPYRYLSGTSMAAPSVAGVVALVEQANPSLTPSQIEKIIADTANPNAVKV